MTPHDPGPREVGDVPVGEPTWRKPAGAFLMIALITVWAVLVASLPIGRLHWAAQAAAYLALGIGWIWLFPFRRLFVWMETGRWG